ncbi:DUF1501 domain-containing protein [Dactylosporangium roseum]|uniref:DUF1501 domain-containing protein n=1 Tax=Dactylosporangium roseum TaxID=47989 RepID=A0ABY5Z650_9ACTN|nr:DUF1501 domain-containing protein [Dactylosporangium roseum]UWZ36967.1 DUF1501 domain-containing protein [Dactylosporangium roseum]
MEKQTVRPSNSLHPECPDLLRLGPNRLEAALRAEAIAVREEQKGVRDQYLELARQEDEQEEGKGVTRRRFFVGAAATATALATSQFLTTQASFAAAPTGTLIHVFLYGGADALSLFAPMNDATLQRVRPSFTLPENTSIPLERGFGLNESFAPLKKYLDAGQLALIPAVSDRRLDRSHFAATDICQLGGLPAETGGMGWLTNLADKLGPGTAFRAIGIGSTLPRSLVGGSGALALSNVGALNVNGDGKFKQPTVDAIKTLFTGVNHPIESPVRAGIDALTLAQKLAQEGYMPANGVRYTGVGNAFKELAQLIKGGANVRIATIGMGGWDTHQNQGTRGGYVARRFGELAAGMAAFFDDLGPDLAANVTVMVSSEFGRRVAENGGGTDHGHGGGVVILSGKKLAGKVLGTWNGLGTLTNGDVPEMNNMFSVFGSVAQGRFGLTDAEVGRIFPRQTYTPVKIYA